MSGAAAGGVAGLGCGWAGAHACVLPPQPIPGRCAVPLWPPFRDLQPLHHWPRRPPAPEDRERPARGALGCVGRWGAPLCMALPRAAAGWGWPGELHLPCCPAHPLPADLASSVRLHPCCPRCCARCCAPSVQSTRRCACLKPSSSPTSMERCGGAGGCLWAVRKVLLQVERWPGWQPSSSGRQAIVLRLSRAPPQVCPANWTEGAATIKPNPKEATVRSGGGWVGVEAGAGGSRHEAAI